MHEEGQCNMSNPFISAAFVSHLGFSSLHPLQHQTWKISFPCIHEVIVNLQIVTRYAAPLLSANPILTSLRWLPNCFRIDIKMLLTTCSPAEYHFSFNSL